ncbi:flagellar motor protein MotB [Bacillus sp. FJAT-44742]|uniref:flagellar motor protein MotB n=1 Tax=Bacillus sp. FJAT-44742 TaxID=2014005 RepID=UPI000C23E17A|nr:flagellar motor protein MotB [Bacillus sp. FJAT-44742]
MRKQKQHNDEHVDESWLIPYADMLTLLLALFIVLFAASEIESEKFQEIAQVFQSEFAGGEGILDNEPTPPELPVSSSDTQDKESDGLPELRELESLEQEINQYIVSRNLENMLETNLTDEGLLLTLLDNVFFDTGSANVKLEGAEVAREISELLYTEPTHEVVVSGHTDDRPISTSEFQSNWELSVIRAVNFMSLLLENNKLDPLQFSAKGFGEHRPIAENDSPENKAKNRRVEVLILPNQSIDTNSEY